MTTEFTLTFREMMSGRLQKLLGTARDVFTGGLDPMIDKTQEKLVDLGKEIRPTVDVSDIKEAHEEVERLRNSMREVQERGGGRGMAGDILKGGLLFEGIREGARQAKEQVKDVFGSGMEAGMTKMELNVMAGKGAGEELYKGTKEFIENSMFGPELFGQDKLLLGYGEKAKNILKDIRQEGDISMGDPMKMESLTEAMGKTIMRGKFDMFEMRQLATTGFNPVQELHRKTGESMASLTEKMKEGKFTIGMYREAMDAATSSGGRFFEMQKKIMETPGGKWKQQTTNIAMAKEELGVALLPVVGRLVDSLKPMIDGLPALFDKLEPVMERAVDGFRDMLPSLREFGSGLLDVLKPVGNFIMSDGVKDTLKDGLKALGDVLHSVAPVLDVFSKGLSAAADSLDYWLKLLGVNKPKVEKPFGGSNYYWSDMPDGGVADTARMRVMSDSLTRFGLGRIFRDHHALDSFNRVQPTMDTQISKFTKLAVPMLNGNKEAHEKANKEAADAMSEAGDAIIGGGRKVTNIHFRNFAEHFTVQAGNLKEGVEKTEEWFKEMYLRLLNIVPA